MGSRILSVLKTKNDKHAVGNLNNWNKDIINLGAKVKLRDGEKAIDNFTIVEMSFDTNGVRICQTLSDVTKKGYLIATVEDYIEEFESISDFFNDEGDMGRILKQVGGKRFEVSNFKKDDTAKEIKNGQKVHFDATTKKYLVSNGATDNTAYATAGNKYIVVNADAGSLDGQDLIRLEIAE